jgi:hypothetical protein
MTSLLKVEGGERFQIAAERRKLTEAEQNPPASAAAPAAAAPQPSASEPASSTLSTVGGEKEAGRQEAR